MKPKSFMIIAGEPSGDALAADLVRALRTRVLQSEAIPTADAQPLRTELAPRFFGAGGPRMAAAGVELAFDMTEHSVIGISEVLKKYFEFRKLFRRLLNLAIERQPDAIIGVDYGGFNLRFGHAIKQYVRRHRSEFVPWNPKIIQFVSPQVWASRPRRAALLEEDYDLLLSIFPFEKDWYAKRARKLRVEFVGHPMLERNSESQIPNSKFQGGESSPKIVLLPGSRADEVRRHWPVVIGAFELLRRQLPGLRAKMILPDAALAQSARSLGAPAGLEIQTDGLFDALCEADLAITKSGTITMECALARVPAVVFYKTSWPTYLIGKQIVTVKYIAMPNLLADSQIFPELVQHAATAENISSAALALLRNPSRRMEIKSRLAEIVSSLGAPGASKRAADAIVQLIR